MEHYDGMLLIVLLDCKSIHLLKFFQQVLLLFLQILISIHLYIFVKLKIQQENMFQMDRRLVVDLHVDNKIRLGIEYMLNFQKRLSSIRIDRFYKIRILFHLGMILEGKVVYLGIYLDTHVQQDKLNN